MEQNSVVQNTEGLPNKRKKLAFRPYGNPYKLGFLTKKGALLPAEGGTRATADSGEEPEAASSGRRRPGDALCNAGDKDATTVLAVRGRLGGRRGRHRVEEAEVGIDPRLRREEQQQARHGRAEEDGIPELEDRPAARRLDHNRLLSRHYIWAVRFGIQPLP